MPFRMTTFVLVPGALHGGWCWKKVVPLLRAAGHVVHTPTLTGLGERAHLLNRGIDLQTHIQDIVNLLEFEDLKEVILVGHSYASMVIEGVAEKVPQRISHIVNLDGPIPSDGRSLIEKSNEHHTTFGGSLRQIVQDEGEGWLIPPSERFRMLVYPEKNALFGVTDDEDQRWMRPRLTPHPMATFEQRLHLEKPEAVKLPRTYIWCNILDGKKITERPILPSKWDLIEIETGHDAMISAPLELSKIFMNLSVTSGYSHT